MALPELQRGKIAPLYRCDGLTTIVAGFTMRARTKMRNLFDLSVMRFLIAIFLLLPNSLEVCHAAPPRQALLGMSLPAAQNTDFFTFFHLVETWREKDSAKRTVVIFKPSSGAFRKLVTFRATLGPQDRIVQAELDLARAFIDNDRERGFANDIAASLLANALPQDDRITIGTLIKEVAFRGPSNPQIARPRPPPDMPVKESLAYLTYVGKRKAYAQELSASTLLMENMKQENEDWLQIRVSLKQ